MTTAVTTNPGPLRQRRSGPSDSLTAASGLGLGIALIWFSILALLPLAAVVVAATEGGWDTFWETLTDAQTFAALRLTVLEAIGVTVVNVFIGTLIAWVLVRDQYRPHA